MLREATSTRVLCSLFAQPMSLWGESATLTNTFDGNIQNLATQLRVNLGYSKLRLRGKILSPFLLW